MAVPYTFASATSSLPLQQLDDNFAACLSSTVTIAQGGTGQTTKLTAFDALSPATTKGDLIVSDGTDNVRLPVGTNGQALVADSTVAYGVKWATASGGGTVTSVDVTAPAMFTVTGSPVTSSGTIAITYSGTALPIANGGTGQTTATTAFDALSPTTTKGDLIVSDGTDNVRLPVGANGYALVADSTVASGVKWAATSGSGTVTSVGVTAPSIFTVTGSPVTASGTIALSYSGTALPVANGGTGLTALGTGVTTALGVNVGTSGAVVVNGGALGTPTTGTLSGCTVDGVDSVGFRNIPINSQSAAYTTVLSDSGKTILHPSTDANAQTFTIDSNANVAYPLGTAITFINMTSQVVTIAITSDTMYLAGTGTTGSRSLAQYGMATAIKLTSTTWIISGNGLT